MVSWAADRGVEFYFIYGLAIVYSVSHAAKFNGVSLVPT